ncbi:YciI family protein [Lelliottia sp.]|uniref:YciI family protein n=1 Tax=Lelliottia sp. TaxID=1898429 RepID=UPI00388F0EA0
MLHAVTLTYLHHEEDIARHLDAHKQWLIRGFKEERIVFAGPLSNGSGGYILFHGDNSDSVHHFLKDGPFVEHNVVSVTLVSIEPTLSSKDFPGKGSGNSNAI